MMTINNLPAHARGQYIVARDVDGELWFYGAYAQYSKAQEVANQVDGLVVQG